MAYIDADFYTMFWGTAAVPDDFNMLVSMASTQIDATCRYRIGANLGNYTGDVKSRIQSAVAVQTKYLSDRGGVSAAMGISEVSSATIGSFSYSTSSEKSEAISGMDIAPLAVTYLLSTGLMYAGVSVCE